MFTAVTTIQARRTASAPTTRQKTVCVPADQSREELLENYLPLVRQVAERVHRHLPRHQIDIDSLVQSGVVGLLEASLRYDAGRGVVFADYARHRIRGEIIEYLRSLDWASRSVRAWGRRQATARSRLTARLGREAEPAELAAELQMPLKEYYRLDQSVSEATLLNLDDVSPAAEDQWRRTHKEHADPASIDPLATLEQKDLVEKLAGAIALLPEQEQQVLTLSYYEELTLREIGQIWGLTEGRICQIRSRAVARLRDMLAEAGAASAPQKKTQKSRAGRRSSRSQPAAQPFPLAKAG